METKATESHQCLVFYFSTLDLCLAFVEDCIVFPAVLAAHEDHSV